MKRKIALPPVKVDTLDRLGSIGRGILFAHLLVTPLLFTQATIEGFEFVKALALFTTVLLLLVVGALALPFLSWTQIKAEFRQPLTLAGVTFVVSAAVSAVASTDWRTSQYGNYENQSGLVTILAYFILFVAARILIRTPAQMRHLFIAVAIAAIGVTVYGLLQAARLDPLNWANHSTVARFNRPFSTFGHANLLGAWLVLALPLVLALATGRSRVALILLGMLMVLMLVLTLSRGAWLGLIGSAIAVALWKRGTMRKRFILATSCCAIALTLAFLRGDAFRNAITSRAERFLDGAGRAEIWSAAGKMFFERPMLGVGPDTFHQHFGRHEGIAFWEHSWGFTPTRAHNEFLHVLATQGLFGIAAVLGILATLAWCFHRAWRLHPEESGLIVACAAALGGFLITEMFGFTAIPCGSLAVVLSAIIARLGEQPTVGREDLAHPTKTNLVAWAKFSRPTEMLIPKRLLQAGLIAACAFLFVHFVADPLRADLQSAAAAEARTSEQALQRHLEATRICPRSPLYWSRLAGHAEECGRDERDPAVRERCYRLAQRGHAEAAACEPGNAFHRAGLGRALAQLACLNRAEPGDCFEAFDAAMQRDPSVAYFYVDASQAALQLGDAERASHYVRAGLDRYPNYGAMHRQAAMLHLLYNRPGEAVPEFDRALAADWKGETGERELTGQIRAEVIRRMGR